MLDADLAAAFDRIDHDHLLDQLGTFPARELVAAWLKAGVVEKGRFTPTEEGTPQGGVISPVLLNVALHGMEQAAGVRYRTLGVNAGRVMPGSSRAGADTQTILSRCATAVNRPNRSRQRLAAWLAPRGLAFNEDKTRIVHLDEGFDFLGFHVRRYRNGKLLIKPSKAAVQRIRERLTAEMRALRGANAAGGDPHGSTRSSGAGRPTTGRWCPSEAFVHAGHPHVEAHLQVGEATATRTSRSTGSSTGTSARSTSPGATGGCSATATAAPTSPSSPGRRSSDTRWSRARRPRTTQPWPSTGPTGAPSATHRWTTPSLRLLQAQRGRCPLCGDLLLHADHEPQTPDEWEQWVTVTRKAIRRQAITVDAGHGTSDETAALRLVHTHCARRHQQ